ncbi:Fur family transcriptional regulator [Poriferisphaera sp. WC338]|uniref:Fur family transcriptional regulator n=1 Tax=Poriferisphaera sp. WC338 TaxID=3425129 RepID=UPI003D81BADF
MNHTAPIKKLGDLFAKHGLRCTRQRTALYEALSKSSAHPTADELFRSLSGKVPAMSLATVYNTLEVFCEVGLAQKLPGAGANGSARYDAGDEPHLHLRCQKTGKIADLPEPFGKQILEVIPENLIKQIEKQLGFKVNQIQIELIGEDLNAEHEAVTTVTPANTKTRKPKHETDCNKQEEAYQKSLDAALHPRMPK